MSNNQNTTYTSFTFSSSLIFLRFLTYSNFFILIFNKTHKKNKNKFMQIIEKMQKFVLN